MTEVWLRARGRCATSSPHIAGWHQEMSPAHVSDCPRRCARSPRGVSYEDDVDGWKRERFAAARRGTAVADVLLGASTAPTRLMKAAAAAPIGRFQAAGKTAWKIVDGNSASTTTTSTPTRSAPGGL